MNVSSIPQLQLPPRSELEIGPDRGAQLADPADVAMTGAAAPETVGFDDLFTEMVSHASALGQTAERQAFDFARGRIDDLHGTMIAAKKAEISLKLVGTVRNKLLEAFHELWRIGV